LASLCPFFLLASHFCSFFPSLLLQIYSPGSPAEEFPERVNQKYKDQILGDPEGGRIISDLYHEDSLCREALNIMLSTYGSEVKSYFGVFFCDFVLRAVGGRILVGEPGH
jgi:hypothetical protein